MGALEVIPGTSGSDGAARGLSLPVSETFWSIQGEGKLAGVPSLFIRLSGCNLRCRWCDTSYASWDATGELRALDSLIELARSRPETTHAVLTGGEPMMFAALTDLSARLAAGRGRGGAGMHVTIETAGTLIPQGGVTCQLISISPKLSNSTPVGDARDRSGVWAARHEQRRISVSTLQQLIDGSRGEGLDRQLKFVVAADGVDKDLEEIDQLLGRLRGWEPADVLLMPEGVTSPSRAFARELAAVCVDRGWRYCPRLHIELWGNERGR